MTGTEDSEPWQRSAVTVESNESRRPDTITVAYEHPWVVRVAHWLNAVAVFVLITSGLRIFRAFPSFGPKIPQQNFSVPPPELPSAAGSPAPSSGTSPSCGSSLAAV